MAHVRLFDTSTGEMLPVLTLFIDKGLTERLRDLNLSIMHVMPTED